MSLVEPNSTDRDLVIAARAGSESAWAALVEHYYPLLLRYLTGRTGDPEFAADLTQDAFLAALTNLDQPGAERAFAAWLYRIAQNRLRADQRRQRLRRFVSLEGLRGVQERAGWEPPTLRQPDDMAAVAAERELVARVLAELSPPLREALLLHSLKGLTASEVAGILGISLAAAERRISRAQTQFRVRYNALVGEAEREG